MSILLSALLLQAAAATPAASPPAQPTRICREMLISSSRLGAVKVCKTRAAWQRWERCQSATRYCAPPRQNTVTVASLPGDKLICKYLKTTGSRIEQEKICATKRQWDVTERDMQEQILGLQGQSSLEGTQTIFRNPSGDGPQ